MPMINTSISTLAFASYLSTPFDTKEPQLGSARSSQRRRRLTTFHRLNNVHPNVLFLIFTFVYKQHRKLSACSFTALRLAFQKEHANFRITASCCASMHNTA